MLFLETVKRKKGTGTSIEPVLSFELRFKSQGTVCLTNKLWNGWSVWKTCLETIMIFAVRLVAQTLQTSPS